MLARTLPRRFCEGFCEGEDEGEDEDEGEGEGERIAASSGTAPKAVGAGDEERDGDVPVVALFPGLLLLLLTRGGTTKSLSPSGSWLLTERLFITLFMEPPDTDCTALTMDPPLAPPVKLLKPSRVTMPRGSLSKN